MRKRLLIGIFTALLPGLTARAAEPYTPDQPPPLAESWRWHAQEVLDGMTLINCVEGEGGSIWFVAETGMVKYDGIEVQTYPVPDDGNLVGHRCMAMADSGEIYILQLGKILEFSDGQFREVFAFTENYDMLFGRAATARDGSVIFGTSEGIVAVRDGQARIISTRNRRASFLLIDSRGDLWTNKVGTGQLLRYPGFTAYATLDDSRWESYQVIPDSNAHLTLTELPDGTLWCANDHPEHGIHAFDPVSGWWYPVAIDADANEKVHQGVFISPDGTILVYGDKRLLLRKDGRTMELTLEDFDFPLTSPFVRSLSSGFMVIGGRRETVYMVDCSATWWKTYQGLNFFCEDTFGREWFIAFNGDIVCHDPSTGTWVAHSSKEGAINTPLALLDTDDGKVWAVGRHDNVAALSIFSDGKWDIRIHPELGKRISHQSVLKTRSGAIILGGGDTIPENESGQGGLLKYESDGSAYTVTHYAPPRIPFRVVGIQEDVDGSLWIGGSLLSHVVDFNSTPLKALGDYRNSWIDSFLATATGDLWVAQWGVGVHVRDENGWISSVDFDRKLSRAVVALQEDRLFPGQVWAATAEGLFNFDKRSWVDEPLSEDLGMLREGGGLMQSPGGTIWINMSSRNWNFRATGRMPGQERFASSFQTVAFKRYDILPETRIEEYESKVYEPGLSHFRWSGSSRWSIAQEEELSYSYRLDGGEWTPYSKRTEVVLETRSNGPHTFEVRARTPYGQIDPTPATVEFTVIPLIWKQPWFILSVLLVVILLVALVVVIVRQRITHLLALEEYKIQFFTNISHELRTPLMVILGPLESLREQVSGKGKQQLEIAYRNARKLVSLLDRLLDFRKAELGKIQSKAQVMDLVVFIRQELDAVRPLADQKRQELAFVPDRKELQVGFDPKHVEVILDNLLTNAIKYTPSGGSISVKLMAYDAGDRQVTVQIRVTDTGPGIPRKELKRVFDPFYQTSDEGGLHSHSTGIGLAHSKSLVEAVGGRIFAESPVNPNNKDFPGTRFIVELTLPLGESPRERPAPVAEIPHDADDDSDEAAFSTENKPLMLIVDDSADIREFLSIEFEDRYTILTAGDGAEGLEIAREHIPDLIVSDVLMPGMNGRDLCRQLKGDQLTSHIPVILLTAQKSERHELAGLETGADEYITKPVNIALMRKRLENLLLNRRRVREFISSRTLSIAINKDELPVNKVDQEFIEKFLRTINENLKSETFDVPDLARRMFMSRMTLYRKVKALTGQSPGNIIRSTRLKKAAQYLETGAWTVSQVIEQVGFMDMSHFSRSFKKEFGCSPTQYIERYSVPGPSGEEEHED